MKKLIITEKPSVAMEFAKALKINTKRMNGYLESDDWVITWCVGHLVTMSYPEVYDENLRKWKLSTLPFIPKEWKYEIISSVKNQFEIVQRLLQREDVEVIYNAGDSGREGEYIQRLVFMMANPNPKAEMKRVWIDSQTQEEIQRGIKEAKSISEYDSLSDSAYLRAKEDYLIGINFSRLLSLIYGRSLAKSLNEDKAVISIGRVMTCVLGMIVTREREIRNFKKQKFYKIIGKFGNDDSNFEAQWQATQESKVYNLPTLYNETGFKKESSAKEHIEYMKNISDVATIKEITKKKTKENPPLLFNLAEIQNTCSKKFKISPDETLNIIQELYEKKLVTYPRTDARVLSTGVAKEISKNLNGLYKSNIDDGIKKYIVKMIEEKYKTNLLKTKYVNDKKITDHYAIIPTGQGFENYEKLDKLKKDVYHIIVKRFLSIFYPSAEYNRVSVKLCIGNEEFSASGKVCINQGYLEVIKDDDKTEKDGEEKNDKNENLDMLNSLKKGEKISIVDLSTKEGETSPPSRYSSGTIILAMENAGKLIEDEELREQIKGSGIGTSATRAEIIKKLDRIEYISINSKTQILTPTNKGEKVYDIVRKSIPDMLNPKLTASWEKGLTMVAQKEIPKEDFMDKLEEYINTRVIKLKKARDEYLYGYY
ncbi:MAG: type IA DNA topoisomerase [Clostridia bacterium]|jgi:DNA topoisomerase-3|nr:type IA DNA topoisomerase [Clostridia bacterium]